MAKIQLTKNLSSTIKILKMKKISTLLLLGAMSLTQAQILFSDDLASYTAGQLLSSQGTWTNNSSTYGGGTCAGSGCTNTTVMAGALNYTNYISSATTNVAAIKPNQDAVGTPLTTPLIMPTTSSTIYYSFLINASVVPTGTPGDVLRALAGGNFNTVIRMQLKNAAGGFTIGGSKNSGTNVYSSTVYPLNTTHLIVIKYTVNSGSTSDDVLKFYVNPTAAAEPATADATISAGSDYAATFTMDRFLLRTNTAGVPTMSAGAFKVAQTYSDLFVSGTLATNNSVQTTKSISIKENPVTDYLKLSIDKTFDSKNATVSIVDASGRVVRSEGLSENINVKSLKAGVYFVQINGGNNKSSLRFIKK